MQPQSQIAANVLVKLLVDLFLRVFRETLLFTTGSTVLGVTLVAPSCCRVRLPGASTRWCCWCILWPRVRAAVPVTVAATERKQAHIIITISANCGEWVLICCMLFQLLQTVVPDHAIGKYSKFDVVGSCETWNEWWLNIMMIITVKGFVPQVIWLCELVYVEQA